MLPETIVRIGSAIVSRFRPTTTGPLFAQGVTVRGPSLAPRLCRSMADFATYFGARISGNPVWDWAETYFAEGGVELWFMRVWSSTAKAGSLALKHGGETSLTATAAQGGEEDTGTWGNALEVAVVAVGAGIAIQTWEGAVLLEESPELKTNAEAIAWAKTRSRYILLTQGANVELPSVVAKAKLAGGTVGAAIATADHEAASGRIPSELGPGQFAIPGQTTEAIQKIGAAHAVANNRFFLADAPNTWTKATLIAAAQALQAGAGVAGSRVTQLVAPWDVIPGLTAYTSREVPPSARLAAQYAKVDALGNPNRGAAGPIRGVASFVNELSQSPWSAQEREELNNAGITISRRRFGGQIATWGVRTLGSQIEEPQWSFAPGVRTVMWFSARAQLAGESGEFDQIDGFGHAQSTLAGMLTGIALSLFGKGALYGSTAEQAFAVNVGEAVNPLKALQEGKLQAQVALKTSPQSEAVLITVINVPLTGEV